MGADVMPGMPAAVVGTDDGRTAKAGRVVQPPFGVFEPVNISIIIF